MTHDNGWSEWQNYILKSMDRRDKKLDSIGESVQAIEIEIAALKVKSGLWGLIGACIPIAITLGLQAIGG